MQPHSNIKNPKATLMKVETHNNKINNTNYNVQSFTENEASSDNKPALARDTVKTIVTVTTVYRDFQDNDQGDKTKLEALIVFES